jgi:anti-sigma factor RsiW
VTSQIEMNCHTLVELVTDYLEGALPEADARRLERHLGTCPGCAEYLEQLRAIAGSLKGVTEESFPAEMRADLIADFRDLRKG